MTNASNTIEAGTKVDADVLMAAGFWISEDEAGYLVASNDAGTSSHTFKFSRFTSRDVAWIARHAIVSAS